MSFALSNERSGLEYNATDLRGLFCRKRNLLSPRFWRMLQDLRRFYREAPALLEQSGEGPTLGDYLHDHGYSDAFADDHLIPMASALWSSPATQIRRFPAQYLVRFMANHHMLQIAARPQWRVVCGGSQNYVRALRKTWHVRERIGCAVTRVTRDGSGASVQSAAGTERFDHAVLACHSDQALALLGDASSNERDVLGAIGYQANEVVLHTDASQLPRRRRAWAAWNALVPRDDTQSCTVSYCMNLLQSLDCAEPIVVTLNRSSRIAPEKILRHVRYDHPLYTHASVAAQRRKTQIQGVNRTWFAGAYWGWGFHEDGMRSAVDVAQGLGVHWP
jgi:predicted NAD/FAD-binding protein